MKINAYTKRDGSVIYFLNGFSNAPKAPAVDKNGCNTQSYANTTAGQQKAIDKLWDAILFLREKDGKKTPFVELVDRINAGEADEVLGE